MGWAPEHIEALRQHVEAGYSFAQVAALLNAAFRTSYTRNSTIGKATRLGLECTRPKGSHEGIPGREPRKARPSPLPRMRLIARPPRLEIPDFPCDKAGLRCAEVEPRHVALLDLKDTDCRWPYGDGPFTFCGHARSQYSASYCEQHALLSFGAGSKGERDALRLSDRLR